MQTDPDAAAWGIQQYHTVPRTTDSSERALSRLTLSFATDERCGWHREQADTSNGALEGSKRVSCLINTRSFLRSYSGYTVRNATSIPCGVAKSGARDPIRGGGESGLYGCAAGDFLAK